MTTDNNASAHNRTMPATGNICDFSKCFRDFRNPELSFSASVHHIRPGMDIMDYLKIFYIYLNINQIKEVFGNGVFPSRLYGGRSYNLHYALTENHAQTLERHGIGLALTMTNHFFDDESYRHSYDFLKVHHRKGNSIICTSDNLAIRIKNDFPDYTLKASIIKNLNTTEKIEKALRLYDYVTLPIDINDNDDFLRRLTNKERIILFGNAGCAYTCPDKSCYPGFSQEIQVRSVTSLGNTEGLSRLDLGRVWFNIAKLSRMGFSFFKMIPPQRPTAKTRSVPHGRNRRVAVPSLPHTKSAAWLCSFPKCGRSWLRFLVANYLKLNYDLHIEVNFHTLFQLLPNEGVNHLKGVGGYQFADDLRFPLIISSHASWREGRFADAPVVFVLRSVPDVVVSYYFHTARLLNSYSGTLKEFIRSPHGGLYRYLRYLTSWAEFIRSGKTPIHLVRYEDLHSRTAEVTAGVLSFLNLPVNPVFLAEAIRISSFEAMQRVEKEKGIAGHVYDFNDPEARRVRKGCVNGHREYLDESDMAHIEKICSEYSLTDEDIAARFQLQ